MIQLKDLDILTIYLCTTAILYVPYLTVYTFMLRIFKHKSFIPYIILRIQYPRGTISGYTAKLSYSSNHP